MLKQVIKLSLLVLFFSLVTPVFADDSDFLPEAVPGEDDTSGSNANTTHGHARTEHAMNADEPALSIDEQHLIDQDQAQFDAALNELHPNAVPNKAVASKQPAIAPPQNDTPMNREPAFTEEQSPTEKRPLQQYTANASHDNNQQEVSGDAFSKPTGSQEQQNLREYQVQPEYKPSNRDW